MRLRIVLKSDLTEEQAKGLHERLIAPEHQFDSGAIHVWRNSWQGLYAFVHVELGVVVGISEASGPLDGTVAGWWIDSRFRGEGYGGELVDLLAAYLKAQGVYGIGRIPIDTYRGEYHQQSSRLAQRLKAHFVKK